MDLKITLLISVGPIQFGMARLNVRSMIGKPFREFLKTPQSKTTTDDFTGLHLHVYYDENDRCEAVEIFRKAAPTLNGEQLIGRPFREVLEWLRTIVKDTEPDSTGLTSQHLGLELYAPNADRNIDDPVEAVYLHGKSISTPL